MSIGRIEKQILEKMQTNAKVRKFYNNMRLGLGPGKYFSNNRSAFLTLNIMPFY